VVILCICTNEESIKQWEEPQSTNPVAEVSEAERRVIGMMRESGSDKAAALSRTFWWTSLELSQPSGSVWDRRAAYSFTSSMEAVASSISAALPFTAGFLSEERRFRHSLRMCPALPQNRQSLLAKR
jgi:hypothetical protein